MTWQGVVTALVPSIGVGLIFWLAIRAIVNADANERRRDAEMRTPEAGAAGRNDDAPGA